MNRERIFELAKEAGFELLDTRCDTYILEDPSDGSAIESLPRLLSRMCWRKTEGI